MTTKKTATKKTATKKAPAKKVAAKKTVAKKSVTKEDSALKKVAQETLDGKWGSGRERDFSLREAGFDPVEVQNVRARLRAASR